MTFNHFPLTHIQDLYTHPALINRKTEYIPILGICHRNLLLHHQSIDINDLIPKLLRPLKIQIFGRFFHFALQFLLDLLMPTAKK
ncbi:hypothetical protein D3C73_1278100 [compost metagenome]